jgi:hypothetical protein
VRHNAIKTCDDHDVVGEAELTIHPPPPPTLPKKVEQPNPPRTKGCRKHRCEPRSPCCRGQCQCGKHHCRCGHHHANRRQRM